MAASKHRSSPGSRCCRHPQGSTMRWQRRLPRGTLGGYRGSLLFHSCLFPFTTVLLPGLSCVLCLPLEHDMSFHTSGPQTFTYGRLSSQFAQCIPPFLWVAPESCPVLPGSYGLQQWRWMTPHGLTTRECQQPASERTLWLGPPHSGCRLWSCRPRSEVRRHRVLASDRVVTAGAFSQYMYRAIQ